MLGEETPNKTAPAKIEALKVFRNFIIYLLSDSFLLI